MFLKIQFQAIPFLLFDNGSTVSYWSVPAKSWVPLTDSHRISMQTLRITNQLQKFKTPWIYKTCHFQKLINDNPKVTWPQKRKELKKDENFNYIKLNSHNIKII